MKKIRFKANKSTLIPLIDVRTYIKWVTICQTKAVHTPFQLSLFLYINTFSVNAIE